MPFKKILNLFRAMREGSIGVNNLTRAADEFIHEQSSVFHFAAQNPNASQANLVKASYLGTAEEGFNILFARRQVHNEQHLDLADAALVKLAEGEG